MHNNKEVDFIAFHSIFSCCCARLLPWSLRYGYCYIYIVKKGERARAQMCYHSKKYTQKRRLIKSGPERNTLITSEAKKQKLSLSTFYSYCTTSFSVLFFVTNRPKCQRPWSCFYGALSLLDRKMPFCCPNFSFGELYKVSFFPSHGSHKN